VGDGLDPYSRIYVTEILWTLSGKATSQALTAYTSYQESEKIGVGPIFSCQSHGPVIQPVVHDPMKSASGGIDGGVEMQSSVASLPPEKVDNGMQRPKRLDQGQLNMLMTELKSQLQERRNGTVQKRPVLGRRPLAERDDLAPLIEQCLTTLREPTIHMSWNKEYGTRLEESRPAKRYGAEVEKRVEYLWNALRVESCRIPSNVN